jgi:FkbM family methyltransferase
MSWLSILRLAGVRHFVARSALGHPFICHLGDVFGENPFYDQTLFVHELELCAAWLSTEQNPMILDVGANIGFWSTQLAQMIAQTAPVIYAFEPVPQTFCKLVKSVDRLHLCETIRPLALAASKDTSFVPICTNDAVSGFAQVGDGALNTRVGNRIAYAMSTCLDDFVDATRCTPSLIKIDIEGSEMRAMQGARRLLAGPKQPAVMFEFNPITLAEVGAEASGYAEVLPGYSLYYVDDFEGQRRPFGSPAALAEIDWVANIFAVPDTEASHRRFAAATAVARARMNKETH